NDISASPQPSLPPVLGRANFGLVVNNKDANSRIKLTFYARGTRIGFKIRDRACLVHRHRWLLEIAHQRAKRADSKVKGDRARHGTVPSRRSRREVGALAYRRWRRAGFPHQSGSTGSGD